MIVGFLVDATLNSRQVFSSPLTPALSPRERAGVRGKPGTNLSPCPLALNGWNIFKGEKNIPVSHAMLNQTMEGTQGKKIFPVGMAQPQQDFTDRIPIDQRRSAWMDRVVAQAVWYLLDQQRQDGSWDTQTHIMWDAEVAVTALVIEALSSLRNDPKTQDKIQEAIQKGTAFIMNNGPEPGISESAGGLAPFVMKLYSYSSTLSFLSKLPASADKTLAVYQIICELSKIRRTDGGFGYAMDGFGTSFHTAFILLGVLDIQKNFEEFDEETIDRIRQIIQSCTDALLRVRTKNGFFPYYLNGHPFASAEKGSAGRSMLCNYALYRAGALGQPELSLAVSNFFEHRGTIVRAFEATDGVGVHQHDKEEVAPYYYLFDHYFAALALQEIPMDQFPNNQWILYAQELGRGVLRMRETAETREEREGAQEGAFYDSPLGGRHYGTAISLLILDTLRQGKKRF